MIMILIHQNLKKSTCIYIFQRNNAFMNKQLILKLIVFLHRNYFNRLFLFVVFSDISYILLL